MANLGFDHFNKYILHDEADLSITVQEVYDAAKDEEDFPHIGMTTGIILDATGKDPLGGSEFTGITLVLRNGWTFFCRTVPASDITIKLAGGNLIAEGSNDRFSHVDNVHYEFGQSTSPALIVTAGVLTPTQQQIRDASTLATSEPIIAGSIDNKLDIIDTNVDTSNTSIVTLQSDITDLLTLEGNTQEWVSPGLLKIYADGQSIGGTTFAEIETRDINGVQTFVIADVRQYIRTK
jgi:hypothetical protein